MHVTIGVLSSKDSTLATKLKTKNYMDHTTKLLGTAWQAIKDWLTLLPACNEGTNIMSRFSSSYSRFGGYCDASQSGASSVWFDLAKKLPSIVWGIEFPLEVQQQMITHKNSRGSNSNSNLELTGLLLHWIVLCLCTDLFHAHIAFLV